MEFQTLLSSMIFGSQIHYISVQILNKARFGIYCLEGDASTWWKSVVASHATCYNDTLTWNVSKAQFDQRYFLASVHDEYAREYQSIVQKGDESVTYF